MSFVPHTQEDTNTMLEAIGVKEIDTLFDEIPEKLKLKAGFKLAGAQKEWEMIRSFHQAASQDEVDHVFLGAGSYHHHIPAAIWEVVMRGEFLTSYTPYQAEVSQGTLQAIFEYQTLLTRLFKMDVASASIYDGATALAEAALMAIRIAKGKQHKILVPDTLHPNYLEVLKTYIEGIGEVEILPTSEGKLLSNTKLPEAAGIILSLPNFVGVIDDLNTWTTKAREKNITVIAEVNPIAMGVFEAPGAWGGDGVDIVVGEGQPLGLPLNAGGPYCGFLCAKTVHLRQVPGRIVGRANDANGNAGFVLTMQAREQHIRRGKATSNICTNQGLNVVANTMYLSLLGAKGLVQVASQCHHNAVKLVQALTNIPGIEQAYQSRFFNECVLKVPFNAKDFVDFCAKRRLLAGYAIDDTHILVAATEMSTQEGIDLYVELAKEFSC